MHLIKCLCDCLCLLFLSVLVSVIRSFCWWEKISVIPQIHFAPGRVGENYKEKDKRGALICRNVF